MTKNRKKTNKSLDRNLLQCFYRYGIFWMLPGESSCPNDSEYVCQRGVEGVRPSNGRPKLTVVSKKNRQHCGVTKKHISHN